MSCTMVGEKWLAENSLSLENWHEFYLAQVREVVAQGLPEIYGESRGATFAWLCDLNAGDVPWTEVRYCQFHAQVMASPELPELRAAFVARFGEDFWCDDPMDGSEPPM